MNAFRNAVADVRRSKTWTKRIYYVSPILEALAKDLRDRLRRPTAGAAEANAGWEPQITAANERAISAMGLVGQTATLVRVDRFEGWPTD